jgi:hypothetical protein
MIQFNINTLPETINIVVALTAESKVMGVLLPLNPEDNVIDYTLLSDTYITGTTTSKLQYIKQSFAPGETYLNVEVTIRGTDILAKITYEDTPPNPTVAWYSMYLGTGFQIDYVDNNGITTYKFKPIADNLQSDSTAFTMAYWNLIDEPKFDSNLFISRGVNNVFESFMRLKTVANVQELENTGFGFYKFYDNGIS